MKKKILILLAVLLALTCLITYAVRSSRIVGHDGLIEKARKEIKNLADIETIEMTVAGKSTIGGDHHLFWIITGNQYQTHSYYPMEVLETDEDIYKLVHMHNGGHQRGQDICFEFFGWGYSFLINNPNCKSLVIGETVIPVTEIPFVYYYPFNPGEYYFLDAAGNELN